MLRNFFRASEVREHRLCFDESTEAVEPASGPSASDVPEMPANTETTHALPDPETMSVEEVRKHMATMIVQTHAEMLAAWQESLPVYQQMRHQVYLEVRKAQGEENVSMKKLGWHRELLSRRNTSAEKKAQLAADLPRDEASVQEARTRRWQLEDQLKALDLYLRQPPTLQQAEYVLTGINPNPGQQNPGALPGTPGYGATMQQNAPVASAMYTERQGGNAVPNETPFQKLEGAMKSAFEQFKEKVGLNTAMRLAKNVEYALTANPDLAKAIPIYIQLLEKNPTVNAEVLKALPPEDQERIKYLQTILGEDTELFEKFLRSYGPMITAKTFERGSKQSMYPLQQEEDKDKQANILAIVEMRKKALAEDQRGLLERIDGKLMMEGVDMDASNFDGEDPLTEVKMLPQEPTQRFFAFFMGLLKWVQSFGIKDEPREGGTAEVERKPEEMSAEELNDFIQKKQSRLTNELPKEISELENSIAADEKTLQEILDGPKSNTLENVPRIQQLKDQIAKNKDQLAALQKEQKELSAQIENLQKILKSKEVVIESDKKIEESLNDIMHPEFRENFTVKDGVVKVEGGRLLSIKSDAPELPAGMREIEGSLSISGNSKITSLPTTLTKISGSLFAYDSSGLTTLPAYFTIGKDLNLRNCTNLSSLPSGLNVGNSVYIEQLSESFPLNVGTDIEISNSLSVIVTEATATKFWQFLEQCATKDTPKGHLWIHSSIDLEKKKFEEKNTQFSNRKIKWPPKISSPKEMESYRLKAKAREVESAIGMQVYMDNFEEKSVKPRTNLLTSLRKGFWGLELKEKVTLQSQGCVAVMKGAAESTVSINYYDGTKFIINLKDDETDIPGLLLEAIKKIQEVKVEEEAEKPNAEPNPLPEPGTPPAEPVPETPTEVTAESVIGALIETMGRLGVKSFSVEPDQAKDVHDNLADIQKALEEFEDDELKGINIFFSAAKTAAVIDKSIRIGYNEEPDVMQKNIENVLKEIRENEAKKETEPVNSIAGTLNNFNTDTTIAPKDARYEELMHAISDRLPKRLNSETHLLRVDQFFSDEEPKKLLYSQVVIRERKGGAPLSFSPIGPLVAKVLFDVNGKIIRVFTKMDKVSLEALFEEKKYDAILTELEKIMDPERGEALGGDEYNAYAYTISHLSSPTPIQKESAMLCIDNALRDDPNNFLFKNTMACVLAMSGKYKKAEDIWNKISAELRQKVQKAKEEDRASLQSDLRQVEGDFIRYKQAAPAEEATPEPKTPAVEQAPEQRKDEGAPGPEAGKDVPEKNSDPEKMSDADIEAELRDMMNVNFLEEFTVKNGVVTVEGDRLLSIMPSATELPKGITEIEGSLSISGNSNIKSLPPTLTQISGNFFAFDATALTALPEGLQVGKSLYLDNCPALRSLPNGLQVKGNLYLDSFFDGRADLDVGGNIKIDGNIVVYVNDPNTDAALRFVEKCGGNGVRCASLRLRSIQSLVDAEVLPIGLQYPALNIYSSALGRRLHVANLEKKTAEINSSIGSRFISWGNFKLTEEEKPAFLQSLKLAITRLAPASLTAFKDSSIQLNTEKDEVKILEGVIEISVAGIDTTTLADRLLSLIEKATRLKNDLETFENNKQEKLGQFEDPHSLEEHFQVLTSQTKSKFKNDAERDNAKELYKKTMISIYNGARLNVHNTAENPEDEDWYVSVDASDLAKDWSFEDDFASVLIQHIIAPLIDGEDNHLLVYDKTKKEIVFELHTEEPVVPEPKDDPKTEDQPTPENQPQGAPKEPADAKSEAPAQAPAPENEVTAENLQESRVIPNMSGENNQQK